MPRGVVSYVRTYDFFNRMAVLTVPCLLSIPQLHQLHLLALPIRISPVAPFVPKQLLPKSYKPVSPTAPVG